MREVKLGLLLVVATLLGVVMVQNSRPIPVKFLSWDQEISTLLLVLIVFVVGLLTGFALARWPQSRKDDLE
ncbi:MAG TPA: hypothetical protein VFX92_02350 [Candidatus Krumholzibacteria bacterium]|nr:hypothetical protein [Candidatus Krumholzibacteria bacterium]